MCSVTKEGKKHPEGHHPYAPYDHNLSLRLYGTAGARISGDLLRNIFQEYIPGIHSLESFPLKNNAAKKQSHTDRILSCVILLMIIHTGTTQDALVPVFIQDTSAIYRRPCLY